MRHLTALIAVSLAFSACGGGVFVRPAGPGEPAPDAAAIWRAATADCRNARAVQAALGLSGRVRGRRVPGLAGATVFAVATPDAMALEGRLPGQLLFKLGGTAERATLLLPTNNRVVVAPAAEIVDALVGIPVGPDRLLALLGGCVTRAGDIDRGTRVDGLIEIVAGGTAVYLEQHREWRPRAGFFDGLMVDYDRDGSGAVRRIQFRSTPSSPVPVSLSLAVKDVNHQPVVTPAMLGVVVPDDARPMSVGELRASDLFEAGS